MGPWEDTAYKKEITRSAEVLHERTAGMVECKFLGRIVDGKALSFLYANSKLFWFASRSEGMPNAVLESLVSGTPVVSLPIEGAMAEIIEQGRNGEIVNIEDPAVFGDAVQRWLKNHAVDRSWIQRRAMQQFNPRSIEREYFVRFNDILSQTHHSI